MKSRTPAPLVLVTFSIVFLSATLSSLASALAEPQSQAQQRGFKTVEAGSPRPTSPASGPYFALVIVNNEYQFQPKLKTAVNDAEAVARVLRSSYGFETTVLLNATRAQILGAINGYRKTLDENASLLIYYAGHGYRDEKNDLAYWLPVDAAIDDNSNWITATDVTSNIKVLTARHVLIVADSCYSGGLAREAVSQQDKAVSLQKMLENPSRSLMASGSLEPVADAGGNGHSIFATAFLAGLEASKDPAFPATSLFNDYVYPVVSGRSSQTPLYTKINNAGVDKGDFVFIHHAGAPGSTPAPAGPVQVAADAGPRSPPQRYHYEAPAPETMALETALTVLQRASDMLPTGDIGQVLAVESMIRSRHSLGGTDLSGLSLKGGRFDSGDFSKATMADADLTRVSAASADFTQADLAFASLKEAHFEGATLEGAKLDYAQAEGTQFQNSKASAIRGFSAVVRGADFTHANLNGARFMFADFRDVVFDGADLSGAYFVGCDLTGASFKKAKLANTDFTGSVIDLKVLDAQQESGACETPMNSKFANVSVVIIDEIPSNRFSGGMEYNRYVETHYAVNMRDVGLKPCAIRQQQDSWWYPIFSYNGYQHVTDDYGRGFPSKLINKRGNDIRSRVEAHYKWLQSDLKP